MCKNIVWMALQIEGARTMEGAGGWGTNMDGQDRQDGIFLDMGEKT
jgi:hypothetical protein